MVCRYLNELKKRKTFERGTAARFFKGLFKIRILDFVGNSLVY